MKKFLIVLLSVVGGLTLILVGLFLVVSLAQMISKPSVPSFTVLEVDFEIPMIETIPDDPIASYLLSGTPTVLDRVLVRLCDELADRGRQEQFEALKVFLTGEEPGASQAEIGKRLGMSPGAVKVAVHRLRRRYRDLLRTEIAETLVDPGEVEDELGHLRRALAEEGRPENR